MTHNFCRWRRSGYPIREVEKRRRDVVVVVGGRARIGGGAAADDGRGRSQQGRAYHRGEGPGQHAMCSVAEIDLVERSARPAHAQPAGDVAAECGGHDGSDGHVDAADQGGLGRGDVRRPRPRRDHAEADARAQRQQEQGEGGGNEAAGDDGRPRYSGNGGCLGFDDDGIDHDGSFDEPRQRAVAVKVPGPAKRG